MLKTENYEKNYEELPFEDTLREFRKQKIFEVFANYKHESVLEIGSGPRPIFADYREFKNMVVIEPGASFYRDASHLSASSPNISVINDLFENVVDSLTNQCFDVVIVGGFLHEIDNAEAFVKSLRKVCRPETIVHSFVPNATSFHRLLALEMGLIKSVYEYSDNDKLFQRRTIFNIDSYRQLFVQSGFQIEAVGSYFVKPFTHSQMSKILAKDIINSRALEGLNKMVKYMPDLGAEVFVTCKIV